MKRLVKVVVDGVEKKFFVSKPNAKQDNIAKTEANKQFRIAVENKAYFRDELVKELIARGTWSEKQEAELKEFQEKIKENLDKLEEGGIELSEAKKIALETRKLRIGYILLSQELRKHDAKTVEGQCDNVYFDTLVSLCSFDENGKRLFESLDDYLDKSEEEYAIACAKELSSIMFDLNDNWEKELPENKFLIEYKFVDSDLNYINSEGKRVDIDGRLIDSEGRFIDEEGNFVNINGERVDENGNKIKEKKPFLVNGTPV